MDGRHIQRLQNPACLRGQCTTNNLVLQAKLNRGVVDMGHFSDRGKLGIRPNKYRCRAIQLLSQKSWKYLTVHFRLYNIPQHTWNFEITSHDCKTGGQLFFLDPGFVTVHSSWILQMVSGPCLNVSELKAIMFQDQPARCLVQFTAKKHFTAAPVSKQVSSLWVEAWPLPTQTLLHYIVHYTLQAELKSLMNSIQTQEQFDDILERLGGSR